MGIFRLSFGGRITPEEEALELIRKVEEFLDENGPMMTTQMMNSDEFIRLHSKYWPKELIGPGSSLHSEFLALLTKIRMRADREYGR